MFQDFFRSRVLKSDCILAGIQQFKTGCLDCGLQVVQITREIEGYSLLKCGRIAAYDFTKDLEWFLRRILLMHDKCQQAFFLQSPISCCKKRGERNPLAPIRK